METIVSLSNILGHCVFSHPEKKTMAAIQGVALSKDTFQKTVQNAEALCIVELAPAQSPFPTHSYRVHDIISQPQ